MRWWLGLLLFGCGAEILPPDAPGRDVEPGDSELHPLDAGHPPSDAGTEPDDDAAGLEVGTADLGFDLDAGVREEDAGPSDLGIACSVRGVPGECLNTDECTSPRSSTPGFCPGPVDFQCCTLPAQDGGTCDEAQRPDPNQGLSEATYDDCPPGMVGIESFCIDRYEAALVEFTAGGGVPWSPFFNPGNRTVQAVSWANAVPQGYINGVQAADACQRAGKRLCTSTEWLRACQGPSGDTYPYGASRQPGLCNDARGQHPAVEYFGTSASWIWSELDHPCINQLPSGLARTGTYVGCVSAEGVYDLMGNLHEWIDDAAGTFRGGYYVDTVQNGNGCLYRTTAHGTSHFDYSTGFRCCADR